VEGKRDVVAHLPAWLYRSVVEKLSAHLGVVIPFRQGGEGCGSYGCFSGNQVGQTVSCMNGRRAIKVDCGIIDFVIVAALMGGAVGGGGGWGGGGRGGVGQQCLRHA